ncbi:MAG: hypothetical protein SFY67_13035 [Candidatus Melainabacteria bacterium]|nr:hypothetical protein [Candidatus Melainabacteria bacterium]
MKNKAHNRSVKQRLSVFAFIALYLLSPFFTNVTIQSAFATESVPVPLSTTTGNELDENALLSPGAAKTQSTVPSSPYEHPTMSLIEQETRSRNSSAAQQVNQDLNNDFANYNETYSGLNQFWNDTIVGKFFNNFLPWIGKNVSEFLYSWIPSAVQYLARALEIFVLNPNIAVNGLANDPRFTISNTPAAQEGQTYINAIAPEVRKLADIMYGIAVDLLLLLFVLCIWKYWADASWGRGGSNLMGAVGRLITTSALMLAWPTIYAFWIQISNEMIKAIYFNSAQEMVSFDQAMATVIKAGLWAVGGLLLNALAPVAGAALGGLAGGPLGGLVGGTIGGFVAFAGLIIFMVFGAILIAQLVYLVTLKSIQTILLTAQYMFAPIFLVMFATPDTENACSGFVRSFVEVSLWSFVWVGFLRLLVVIMNTDFSPWGKVVLGLGILQLMISVPAFIARAQISPMSDFLSAGMITGGLVKGAAAIGNTANTFAGYWADHRNKSHTIGGAQGAQKSVSAQLAPQTQANLNPNLNNKLNTALNANGSNPPAPGVPGANANSADDAQGSLNLQGGKMNTPPPIKPNGTPPAGPGGPKGPTPPATPTTPPTNPPTKPGSGGAAANAQGTLFDLNETDKAHNVNQQAQAIPGATTGAGAANTTGTGASNTTATTAKNGSLQNIKEAMKAPFKPGALQNHSTLAQFLGGMWARAAANSARDLSSPIIGNNEGSALIGSMGGGVGLTQVQKEPMLDADGNHMKDANGKLMYKPVDDVRGAQMLAASGIVAQGAKNEIFSDKMRQAAIAAGYDRPKGIGDRMASGIMMGLSGKHWSNTAAAKQNFQHGMFKEGAKGAMAWVQGRPGNAVTDHLNSTLGYCGEDEQVDLLAGIMDPENINSGFKPEAVQSRMRIASMGLGWDTWNNAAASSPATKTVTQAEALPAIRGTASFLQKSVASTLGRTSGPDIATVATKASSALTPGHGKAITQVMVKYGDLNRTGNDAEDVELICNSVDIVQDVYGPNARPNNYLETYDALVAAKGLSTEPPVVDNGSNTAMLQKLNITQSTVAGNYSRNYSQSAATGGESVVRMMASAGVRGAAMSNPKVVQVAAQIDHSDSESVRAFGTAANELGDNISVQRVHIIKEMMASDPGAYRPDSITDSDVYVAEAVAHIQSTSNNDLYAKHAYINSDMVRQVSRQVDYKPGKILPNYTQPGDPEAHRGYTPDIRAVIDNYTTKRPQRGNDGGPIHLGRSKRNAESGDKEIDEILDSLNKNDPGDENA